MIEIHSILKRVEEIEISGNMCLKCLRAEQDKLIAIDHELRNFRKNSVYRITFEKCTEILNGINYAVSIYLPKERKLGISLIKEAVEYLKVQIEILKFWKDPEEELKVEYYKQRTELFTEIRDAEIERYRANRELVDESPSAKRHNELVDEVEIIERKTEKMFAVLRQKDAPYRWIKPIRADVSTIETAALVIEV